MTKLSPNQIADIILNKRAVCDLDTDSRIREAANRLTARAFFEVLDRMEANKAFTNDLSALLSAIPADDISVMIGWSDRDIDDEEEAEAEESFLQSEPAGCEYYLKLVFRNEAAAYYQFSVFPNLEADYILGAARKREGAVQHLRLELAGEEDLQTFIESCRNNPHFLRVEHSTAAEFQNAPSNAI